MLRLLIGGMLIVHGLIVAAQSTGAFGRGDPITNPSWLNWWPTALGQSWLLVDLGVEQTVAARLAGVFWLIGGLALVGAGLAVFGVLVPQGWWRTLAIGGAGMSLLMLLFYLHPFYGIGLGASAAILVALLWARWPTPTIVGA